MKKIDRSEAKEKYVDITEFVEGTPVFESSGISEVKVTRKGEVQILRIPIKSSGVSEMMDQFSASAPTPPTINKVVHPNSDIGRELKLTRKEHVVTFDLTDPAYIKARDKFQSELGIKIVLKGLNTVFKTKDGQVVEDEDRKIEILKGMGLTGEQFTQLVQDISLLTKWEEERENDFLSE